MELTDNPRWNKMLRAASIERISNKEIRKSETQKPSVERIAERHLQKIENERKR